MWFASLSMPIALFGRGSSHEMYKHIWHRSLLLLLRRTSSTSCTCMVVKTKRCGACLTTQDRLSLSKRPGMRCTGSRKQKLRMCKNVCLMYMHKCSHTLIMHICKTNKHITRHWFAFLKEQWDMHDEENPHELCLSWCNIAPAIKLSTMQFFITFATTVHAFTSKRNQVHVVWTQCDLNVLNAATPHAI